jgi:hypothetical protein
MPDPSFSPQAGRIKRGRRGGRDRLRQVLALVRVNTVNRFRKGMKRGSASGCCARLRSVSGVKRSAKHHGRAAHVATDLAAGLEGLAKGDPALAGEAVLDHGPRG